MSTLLKKLTGYFWVIEHIKQPCSVKILLLRSLKQIIFFSANQIARINSSQAETEQKELTRRASNGYKTIRQGGTNKTRYK